MSAVNYYCAIWRCGVMETEKMMLNWRGQIMRMRELAVNPFATDSEIDP
jgi:hypothetical protein